MEAVLFRLPQMTVQWRLKLVGGDKELKTSSTTTPIKSWERKWVDVPVGEECVLLVEVRRSCLRGGVSEGCSHLGGGVSKGCLVQCSCAL